MPSRETKPDLTPYRTLIFDCDGVLLNSNSIKTEAFYKAALPYGRAPAESLRAYHLRHGGVSRYHKFRWFLTELMGQPEPNEDDLQALLDAYTDQVVDGMLECELAHGLQVLREQTAHARWIVISGSDQEELRSILQQRGIDGFFDGGIYGSPRTKWELIDACSGHFEEFIPALFFGDTRVDFEVSEYGKIDFCFVWDWSEMSEPPASGSWSIKALSSLVS